MGGGISAIAPPTGPEDVAGVYLATLSAASASVQASALRRIVVVLGLGAAAGDPSAYRRVPWWLLDARKARKLRARMLSATPGYSPTTINQSLCALRGTWRACFEAGRLGARDLATRLRAAHDVWDGGAEARPRVLSPTDLARLRLGLEPWAEAERWHARLLLELGAGAGATLLEAARMTVRDVDVGRWLVRVGAPRVRAVRLGAEAMTALVGWLQVRRCFRLRTAWLLPALEQGRLYDARSRTASLVRELGRVAASGDVAVTARDLRATFQASGAATWTLGYRERPGS